MVILVLENKVFKINNFSVDVEEEFPKMSRRYVDKNNCSSVIKEFREPPLLTEKWFARVSSSTPLNIIEELALNDLVVALVCFSKVDKLRDVAEYLTEKSVEYKYYDSSSVTDEQLIKYITEHLDISVYLADKIRTACRGNLKLIQENILMLSSFTPVTEEHLKNYMVKANEVSLRYLSLAILGYNFDRKFNYRGTVKLLYQYKNASKFLLRFLNKEVDTTIKLFEFIDRGELRFSNIQHFLRTHSRLFKGLSPYYVETVLNLREYTSIEYLFTLKDMLQRTPSNKITFAYLINYIKIGQPGGTY